MKTILTALLFLTLLLPAKAQFWATLPAQQTAPTNGLGFLVHNPSGYARGYWSNFMASITASNAAQIASSNLVTAAQVATQVAASNFVSTSTMAASTDSIVSGQLKTNTGTRPILVIGMVQLTGAAVSGNASMQLRVLGFCTNSVTETTTASFFGTFFFALSSLVPAGSEYTFTNNSSGAGNSSTLSRVSRLDF